MSLFWCIFLLLTLIASAQVVRNPNQIALNRWCEAAIAPLSIRLGDAVEGLVFDEDHVWAIGRTGGSGFVERIRASDGCAGINQILVG